MDLNMTSLLGTSAASIPLHAPARAEGETFAEYKERRANSAKAAQRAIGAGLNGGTSSRQRLRDAMRKNGTMGKRIRASDALMAAWAEKRITKAKRRDKHGAYTLVGKPRRIWLAGISAQRGY